MCGTILQLGLVVAIVELWVLIEVGARVGALTAIGLLGRSVGVGLGIVRGQGLTMLDRVRRGELDPQADALGGPLLVVAAGLLVLPGLLSDVLGYALLVPPIRRLAARRLARWLIQRGRGPGGGPGAGSGTIIVVR